VRVFLERAGDAFDLKGALLYGSRARHSHRPDSDADLAVLLRGASRPFLDTKLALADIAFDVLLETGILIPLDGRSSADLHRRGPHTPERRA